MYSTLPYSQNKYNFVALIQELFETKNLKSMNEHHVKVFEVGMDSITSFHNRFYNKYRSGWPEMETLYKGFIADIVSPLFKEDFLYQSFPTFRVHLANNVAVGAFHTDAEFGHPAGEVNFIIPITKSDSTASVWVETNKGSEDYRAIPLAPGRLVVFNGNELRHGNKINLTGKTRVSMDFRALPISKYDENNAAESITQKTKFKEGAYYTRFKK